MNISPYDANREEDKFKDLIMLVDQDEQSVIMRITDSFSSEDIQQVINSPNDEKLTASSPDPTQFRSFVASIARVGELRF